MNWTAIGALAELLGAIGVIASLLYLARQMKHGAEDARRATVDARRAAAQAVFSKMNTVFETMSANPQLADVFRRGMANLSALGPEEAVQFSSVMFNIFRPYEELLHYKRAGAVEDWVWESVERVVLPVVSAPGPLEWWAKRESWFTSAFQAHIGNVLPKEAVEMLTAFKSAVEGKNFRAGILIETESSAPPLEEVR